MTGLLYKAERDPSRCDLCGSCEQLLPCSRFRSGDLKDCIGCGACVLACPNEAISLVEWPKTGEIPLIVNGDQVMVPERITVQTALRLLGYHFEHFPTKGTLFAPCGVGGCWSCAVEIDGTLCPSCVTPVHSGMVIHTDPTEPHPLRRRVHGWSGHGAGGVGTPWWIKGTRPFIEVATFACGCNLRCPQCQNWTTTYNGMESLHTPKEAAILMTGARRRFGVDRMAISGGESTLNPPWLLAFLQHLKALNPDPAARLHVDTNATLLTKDYIDALVEVGMTDIGPDLKGLSVDTFQRITGVRDGELAERYHRTSWNAVRYLVEKYRDKIFIGIGIPYNRAFISNEEIASMGGAIERIDPTLQVCVLDYRPAFRARHLQRPGHAEMATIKEILEDTGLTTVICQTESGYLGPDR